MSNDSSVPGAADRLPFRKDIEGLRAVAILLVVGVHAGVPGIAGGFVGVDVFFVLSGYLITGLLLAEQRAIGQISLRRFYARRMRRLLPGMLLVFFVTALAAALLLAPFDQVVQTQSGIYAVLWLSNVYFALMRLDYFAPEVGDNLFLHTWSLGVEEQFYLVWPLLLMFLLGTWQWQGSRFDELRLRRGMLVVLALCLGMSAFLGKVQPQWGFYLMPSRAWQFALGALAFTDGERWRDRCSMITHGRFDGGGVLIACGLAGIAASAALIDATVAYPGLTALVPCTATAAVLVAGSRQPARRAQGLLHAASLQYLGRWSYGWYLWHWPVLLLGMQLRPEGDLAYRIALAALALACAAFSHAMLERPVRASVALAPRPCLTLSGGLAAVVICAMVVVQWRAQAKEWALAAPQLQYFQARFDLPVIYSMGCDEWFYTADVKLCWFGERDAPHTAVLIGDSVLAQWFPALVQRYTRPGWRFAVMTKSACPMVDESFVYGTIRRRYVECDAWRPTALSKAAALAPEVLIMGSGLAYPFDAEAWSAGTRRVLDAVAGSTGNVVLLTATPVLGFDGPRCLAGRAWRGFLPGAEQACARTGTPAENAAVNNALVRAASSYANAQVLDTRALVCAPDYCAAERAGRIVYRDAQHISADFAASVSAEIGSRLDRIGVP